MTTPATAAEIDRSCRWPVGSLVLGAVFWLVMAGGLALLAAIKLHAPEFPGDSVWLTYGRVQAAAGQAFVFGFASLAGLGTAAWLTARLSETRLVGGRGFFLAGGFWNLGVMFAVLGVLLGHSTGVEGFEAPGPAAVLLLASYLVMAAGVLLTFLRRQARGTTIVQEYVLGALLSFPWVFMAAEMMAVWMPLRGVLQTAAGAWGWRSLLLLWLGFLGLASLYHLLPGQTATPVRRPSLARAGFWTLALVAGFSGIHRYHGGAMPGWMTRQGWVGAVLLALPVAIVAASLSPMLSGGSRGSRTPVRRFATGALAALVLFGGLSVVDGLGTRSGVTQFTLFAAAVDQVYLYGFVGLALLGMIYDMIPRLLDLEWPAPGWVRAHRLLAWSAVGLWGVAHAVGGWAQGSLLKDPSIPFEVVVHRSLPYARAGSIAHGLYLLGSLALAANLIRIARPSIRIRVFPVVGAWLKPLQREERA